MGGAFVKGVGSVTEKEYIVAWCIKDQWPGEVGWKAFSMGLHKPEALERNMLDQMLRGATVIYDLLYRAVTSKSRFC